MPISYEYGGTETAKLAQVAAKERTQRERESQALAIQQQKELAQFNIQLQTESEKRARAWELEKMEIASRNDFAMQEMERQAQFEMQLQKQIQEQQEMNAKIKAVQNSDIFDSEEKEEIITQMITGVPVYAQGQKTPSFKSQLLEEQSVAKAAAEELASLEDRWNIDRRKWIFNIAKRKIPYITDPETGKEREMTSEEFDYYTQLQEIASGSKRTDILQDIIGESVFPKTNEVTVIAPDGTQGTVPADQLAQALREGYKRVQ